MDYWNGTVSLLIACIELILLINILFRGEKNKNNYLAMVIILLLMIYQVLEFVMCGLGFDSSYNAFFAFTDISFLPPLGLFFVLSFYNYKSEYFILLFLPAIVFIFYYSTIINRFTVNTCTVFYAIYKYPLGDLYGFIYYTPIVITMGLLFRGIRKSAEKKVVHLSKVLLTSYILISIPVIIAFMFVFLNQMTPIQSIVSVMCKFAVILAIALTYLALNNNKMNE